MQLFYRERGNREAPPLIILHGLWGASENWLPVAGFLSERFHVLLPDLRNHGNSPHVPVHRYEDMCADVMEWIHQLHLPRQPFMVGHSMGGKVLMRLLLEKPEIADKAAVIDIAPKTYSGLNTDQHQKLLDFAVQFPMADFKHRDEIHRAIREAIGTEELCQILFKSLRKGTQEFEWKINVEVVRDSLSELMAWAFQKRSISKPILFVRGEWSDYIMDEDITCIHSFFPEASLLTIPRAHHCLHAEQPQLLAQSLLAFFLGG